MIEIKTFLFILVTNFVFKTTEDKILKANVYVRCVCGRHLLTYSILLAFLQGLISLENLKMGVNVP